MNINSWLILAFFFWISGFLQLKVLDPGPKSRLVYAPKWMFLLFGAPRHSSVPSTVLPARSVYLQTLGLTMAIYGILFVQHLVKDPYLSGLIGFSISMILGGFVSLWLDRKHPYLWKNHRQDGKAKHIGQE